MFGKGRGGLEQAAVDYHEALCLAGCDVTSIIHPKSAVKETFEALPGDVRMVAPMGEWDPFAKRKLQRIAGEIKPDMAICHGNRAIGLALKALRYHCPVVGVAHNYNIRKRFPKCDAIFCITKDLLEEMVHLDITRDKLCHIPNMIRTKPVEKRDHMRSPVVIGTMGRFVTKKGFDIFLQSIKSLKEQGIDVRAIVGGGGELADELKMQVREYDIANQVTFPGWIEDKDQFFQDIDIFVLPSHHEPFGIVLIEAMAAGLPCITTDTEGPCEIIKHDVDAIMIEKAKPYLMANEIMELIDNPEKAYEMGHMAHLKARDKYGLEVVSEQLGHAVETVKTLVSNED